MELERLGKYEIRRVLGKGAMGTVYEGWDPAIERKVAIKTVRLPHPNDMDAQEEVARFRREAQAAGRLSHPNIVGVYDAGETGDLAWIVMEYVDGPSLKAGFDRNERMAIAEIGRVMDGLLAGLAYSHQRGVVHRDIKPANIMLTLDGAVKIADFGIARIESSSMTQVGTVLGTPAYMSPEQFRGEPVDARSDIYSAGVVLYQLLTGERPFEGSASAIMHKVLNTEPPRPSDLAVTAPPALDAVVTKAMAKRPSDRFSSAAEFAAALRQALAGPPASPSIALGADAFDSDATMVSTPIRGTTATIGTATASAAATDPVRPAKRSGSAGLAIGGGIGALAAIAAGVWFFVLRTPEPEPAATPPSAQVAAAPQTPPPPSAPQPPPPTVMLPPLTPTTTEPPQVVQTPAPDTKPPAASQQAETPPAQTAPAVPAQTATAPDPTGQTAEDPPQQQVAVAGPTAAAIREALGRRLANLPCTLAEGDMEGDRARVVAITRRGGPEDALNAAIDAASPSPRFTDLQVRAFSADYCPAIDAVRGDADRFGAAPSGLRVTLRNGGQRLYDHDAVLPVVTMPDFPGYLTLLYLTRDEQGEVWVGHLHPNRLDPGKRFPAGQRLELEPKEDEGPTRGTPIAVGAPFGTDMMLVIATAQPLFSGFRSQVEPASDLLPALDAALAAARQRGDRIAVNALVLETAPRP